MITFLAAIMVLASVGVVSWPLIRGIGGRSRTELVEDTEVSELLAQKDDTLFAISEIESDYDMGNLSQDDYRELRQKYEEKAIALIKTVDELRRARGLDRVSDADVEIEARVSGLRAAGAAVGPDIESQVANLRSAKAGREPAASKFCPDCGAQLEADDQFCSRCGTALSKKCQNCAAAVNVDDRFCFRCGAALSTGEDRRRVS